jgi:hypothetical protein
MLASVELKKRENRDDLDFLQMNGYVPCGNSPFSTSQLSAFIIIKTLNWDVATRSERRNKKSCNKNAIKNTEMLEKYIYCIPIKKIIKVF